MEDVNMAYSAGDVVLFLVRGGYFKMAGGTIIQVFMGAYETT